LTLQLNKTDRFQSVLQGCKPCQAKPFSPRRYRISRQFFTLVAIVLWYIVRCKLYAHSLEF